MTDAEVLERFRLLSEMAAEGNDLAEKVLAWFDQVSDQAGITATYPDDTQDAIRIMREAGNTATLFWGARLLRWQIEHPGQIPTHYTYTIGVEFDSVEVP